MMNQEDGGTKAQAQGNPNSASKIAIPPYMKATSGSLGGIMEASYLQPIDVIKTRLQLYRSGNYKGIAYCGTTIARTEGVHALWKGLTPFATLLTLKYELRMGSNAVFQSVFKDPQHREDQQPRVGYFLALVLVCLRLLLL